MKKVSTAVAKQTNNFAEQKLTMGLDLGDRSSWYCVLDEAGTVLLEQRLSTAPKAMREVLGGMPRSRDRARDGDAFAVGKPAAQRVGHAVIVAHARNLRLIGESRRKDDRLDAQTLAWLARIDPQWLCPVRHRSAKAQADLALLKQIKGVWGR
jgi:transposase